MLCFLSSARVLSKICCTTRLTVVMRCDKTLLPDFANRFISRFFTWKYFKIFVLTKLIWTVFLFCILRYAPIVTSDLPWPISRLAPGENGSSLSLHYKNFGSRSESFTTKFPEISVDPIQPNYLDREKLATSTK